jgi:hypothetical protein
MVYNGKKKALYEVMGRAGSKPGYEQLHNDGSAGENPSTNPETPSGVVRWTRKLSFAQFNAGKIEFSIPYQVGIAIVLGTLLTAVVLFRLGQWVGSRDTVTSTPTTAKPVVNKPVEARPAAPKPASQDVPAVKQPVVQNASAADVAANQPVSTGKNRIVLKIYQVRSHLEPAKEFFDKMGVTTEIIEKGNWYYLVTKNKYDNPEKAGTDGYLAKQKIIELGAGYKAPVGFETFGPKPFSDAFGMRFDE